MSLRDWSSDVCSSDLVRDVPLARARGSPRTGSLDFRAPPHPCEPPPAAPEIGRASCRERVSISVGDGSFTEQFDRLRAFSRDQDAAPELLYLAHYTSH